MILVRLSISNIGQIRPVCALDHQLHASAESVDVPRSSACQVVLANLALPAIQARRYRYSIDAIARRRSVRAQQATVIELRHIGRTALWELDGRASSRRRFRRSNIHSTKQPIRPKADPIKKPGAIKSPKANVGRRCNQQKAAPASAPPIMPP